MVTSLQPHRWDRTVGNLECWTNLGHALLVRFERILVHLPVFCIFELIVEEATLSLLEIGAEEISLAT